MTDLEIIRVTPADVGELQKIAQQTFSETFGNVNTKENMTAYLESSFSHEKLMAELNDREAEIYFAMHDKKVIGYLKVNVGQSQTELRQDNALEIERIYVLKAFLGRHVGHRLLLKAMELAQGRKVDYVWLGVWEENHRARAFYEKNGFVTFNKHVFKLGDDEQIDIMMKRVVI